MALQNRVDPTGALCADPMRGMFMGNRGGKIHQPDKTLGRARWASRQWIICVTRYKHWHRTVWETGYTELFFFDEPTALAAGHRPCFLCQRNAANAYMKAACTNGPLMSAPVLDRVLDAERRTGYTKRTRALEESTLPDAAMFACDDAIYALRGTRRLRWSFAGYTDAGPRQSGMVNVLTPPTTVQALANGYSPVWHPSAG